MSTNTKPKTPATATTVASNNSSETATTQLKQQFSNLFGFFSKVSDDATKASTTLANSVTQKGFTGLLEALNKKVKESQPAKTENVAKPSDKENTNKEKGKEKGDKSHHENKNNEVKPTEKEKTNKDKANKEDKGEKSHREKTPQQTVKEAPVQLQPSVEDNKKPTSAKNKPVDPPAARFNSFGDLFGSITNFVSQAVTSIQTGSSNVYKKLEEGIDINARVKKGFRPTLIKGDAKKVAVDQATKKRLEEAKKMKENFEKQLKSLDKEIAVLEKGEDSHVEDGSNRSRQNDRQPKKFRISGQKSFRESSDKSIGSVNQGKPVKKMLNPLDDGKHAGKKWQEGEPKGLKAVASQPLYMRMEKEFMQNVIFPELEARKEKLKMKREFYKPMDDKELREHALKYEERKKNLQHSENPEKLAPLHFAKSNAYKRVLEQEKEDKVKTDQRAEERKQLKDKAQQYAKIVKEMFFPKPDPKDDLISKENLQEIIARSQKAELPLMSVPSKESNNTSHATVSRLPPRKKRVSQDIKIAENVMTQPEQSPERNYVPHNYLKRKAGNKVFVSPPVVKEPKEQKDDMILPQEGFDEEQQTEVKPAPIKKKYVAKPRMTSMSPSKTEKKLAEKGEDEVKNEVLDPEMVKKSYPNYLVEVRKKRIEQEKKTGKGKYGHWEKVLKNKDMTQQEKMINIMDDINRLEAQAKKKEGKLKRHDPTKDYEPLELEDEVGEMYLETIKAKLAIIKDLA